MSDNQNMTRVSKQNPCPVCGKPDWCLVAEDGSAAICPRIQEGSVKHCGQAGWLHVFETGSVIETGSVKPAKYPKTVSPKASVIDFQVLYESYRKAITPEQLQSLASSLGVTSDSLDRLGVGWDGSCFTIAMRDSSGKIIGIQRRSNDNKYSLKSSEMGLFIPAGLSPDELLLACEGASDTAAALDLGFDAVGRPNCDSRTDLVTQFCKDRDRIAVIADNDTAGKNGAKQLAEALADQGKDAKVICPPDGINDLRQWLNSGLSREELEKAISEAEPVKPDSEKDWELPAPLGDFDLPEFPIEAFPFDLQVLREYAKSVAESFQVPLALPAMLSLAVGGAALAKKVVVHVRGDHWEPVNLFVAVALPPANRKSGVFRTMTEPLVLYEKLLLEKLAPEIEKQNQRKIMLEDELKIVRKKAVTCKNGMERLDHKRRVDELVDEIQDTKVEAFPQLIADDATPESVTLLLSDNHGKIAILSPEGDVFDLMAGRYSSTPNLGVYLKGHAGDDIRVNRASKDFVPRILHKPALTIGIAIQPEVLRGLTLNKGFRGRGLLGRFLYSLPDSILGFRKVSPDPIDGIIKVDYENTITRALELGHAYDDFGTACPHTVDLSQQALAEFDSFAVDVERRIGPGGDLEPICDWAGKLPGAACRIAGILHCLMHIDSGRLLNTQIAVESMSAAVKIAQYLIPHAKAAFFEMGTNPAIDLAEKILSWLKNNQVSDFTKRQVYNALRGSMQTVSELEEPLEMLMAHGYIRDITEERSGPGRKPSPKYKTNSLWLAQNTHNTQNCQISGDSAEFATRKAV